MIKIYFNRLLNNKLALAGLLLIILIGFTALLAPVIAPKDPFEQNLLNRLSPPSRSYLLGTDDLGRDVLSRMIYGTRVSLSVGIIAVSITIIIGCFLGLIAGYFGRWLDAVIMRFVDIMLCFPTFFLILMIIAFLEPNIMNIMIIIGLTSWTSLARLVRAETLSIKEREYIASARIIGLSTFRIMVFHIFPNIIAPVIVVATLGVGGAILAESSLSFLGLGVQPPNPSWGNMLTAGKDYIHMAWWLTIFPGLAIFLTVLAFNLLGEGLRDVIDPRN